MSASAASRSLTSDASASLTSDVHGKGSEPLENNGEPLLSLRNLATGEVFCLGPKRYFKTWWQVYALLGRKHGLTSEDFSIYPRRTTDTKFRKGDPVESETAVFTLLVDRSSDT